MLYFQTIGYRNRLRGHLRIIYWGKALSWMFIMNKCMVFGSTTLGCRVYLVQSAVLLVWQCSSVSISSCVCVCVYYECYNSGSHDTSLCLIVSSAPSEPPVSCHCCREDTASAAGISHTVLCRLPPLWLLQFGSKIFFTYSQLLRHEYFNDK